MREADSNQYHLTTRYQLDAPIGLIWDAILHAEAWPSWWIGVERVVTLEHGDPSGLGARRRCTCKSFLPYRLTFVTRVTRIEPLRLLEGRVDGELEGVGCCRLERSDALTLVRYDWQVRTTRWWMNLFGPLAKPLFLWNHDAIMRAGGIGLARHLNARPATAAPACDTPRSDERPRNLGF
jgi:hypothetical protein